MSLWQRRDNKGCALPLSLQAEMDMTAWGVDLAAVEEHINSHRSIHNAIGDYRWQLDKIKADLVLLIFILESLAGLYHLGKSD